MFDPEIPVNVYELGLIYDMDVDGASNVYIRMTLTAPGCPSAQQIPLDVERRVREVAGLRDVKVEVVWDPPWTKDRMSDAAKLTLGMFDRYLNTETRSHKEDDDLPRSSAKTRNH